MSIKCNQERLLELISCVCDERLDESLQIELQDILLHDEESRRIFIRFLQMHGDLQYCGTVASGTALHNALEAVLHEQRAFRDLPATRGGSMTEVAGGQISRSIATPSQLERFVTRTINPLRRHLLSYGIAASLLFVVGVVAVWLTSNNSLPLVAYRQPQQIANITGAEGARWSDQSTPSLGDPLMKGQVLVLTEGVVFVGMGSGTELVLQSPCSVRLQSANAVALVEGHLTVQAAKWSKGFQVDTDVMNIVDLGTKFCVSADNSGRVEAHVLEGQIRVEPLKLKLAGRRSLLLSTGEGVRIDLQGDIPKRLKANYVGFVTNTAQFLPYKPIPIHNTGVGLAWGDEDSHWRITAGASGGDFSGSQHAVVCRPDSQYLANVPGKSQWIAATENLRPGCTPNSSYTFETHFDLSGYDLSTVAISGQLLADNGVKAVRINGESVAITPWIDNAPGQKFHRFRKVEIKKGLVPGRNKIEIDVWNGIYSEGTPQPNPMALRAEWEAYGRPISLNDSI